MFKLMKKLLLDIYTFILVTSDRVLKVLKVRKKKLGVKIPNNKIITGILKELGHPIVTSSLHEDDELIEYITDPKLIYQQCKDQLGIIIEVEYGDNQDSVNSPFSGEELEILRKSKSEINNFL